jgi:hypothetical protein
LTVLNGSPAKGTITLTPGELGVLREGGRPGLNVSGLTIKAEGGERAGSEPQGQYRAARAVPGEVGLVGLGYHTQAVLDLCQGAGIRVAFVVDDRPEDQPGHTGSTCLATRRAALASAGVPLLPGAEFFPRLEKGAGLPALVASSVENRPGCPVSADPYLRNARLVREVSGGALALWHPVTLAHALELPAYRGRVALFGFPGSGNILAQHLLAALGDRAGGGPPPAQVGAVAALAEHYYVSTLVLLRHLLRQLRPEGLDLVPNEFPTADLSLALPGGDHALALHVPSNRHLASYFHHTHAIPTRLAVDEFTRLGAPCVAVIRHPCETILSWASKLSRPPSPLLDWPWFLFATGRKLAEWHRHLVSNEGRVVVLRYEDLVARQRRPLQALAERLGVGLSEEEIGGLYDRYLHRDLLPALAPGHYYQGGNDKWKQYFHPRHLRQLVAAGFESICDRWGYDLALTPGSARAPASSEGGPTGQKAGALPLDTREGFPQETLAVEPYPLMVQSRSEEVSQALLAALYGPDFLEHLNAGGLGPEPPPWVLPIPWASLARAYHPEYRFGGPGCPPVRLAPAA